jgi:hypothetical protein
MKKKTILITHPLISKDWDFEKNKDLLIENVGPTEKVIAWWNCERGHSYKVSPYTRIRTNGCKFCNKTNKPKGNLLEVRLQTGRSKRFSDVASDLVIAEWASDLNELSPDQVTSHSKREITWRCGLGHVWVSTPNSRMRGRNCPVCNQQNKVQIILKGKLKKSGLSLMQAFPDLIAKEWDYQKNILDPNTLTPKSNYKVFWKCKYGHSWDAVIANRSILGSGCPFCTNQTSKIEIYILCELRTIFDGVEWRKKFDGVEADIYLTNEKIAIEIDGEYWHRNKHQKDIDKSMFFSSIGIKTIRVRADKLPKTNDLSVYFSKEDNFVTTLKLFNVLAKELDSKALNQYLQEGEPRAEDDYKAMISRLPAPPEDLSLKAAYPVVANEWDYEKNVPLTPELFTPFSDHKFWWICSKGHSWEATIKNRTLRNSKCPKCYQNNLSKNVISRQIKKLGSIAQKYPTVVPFWSYEENEGLCPSDVSASINNVYSWKCIRNHTFTRMLKTFLKNQDCPICNSIEYTNPEFLKEWDYEKNARLTPSDVSKGSGKAVWWLCSNNHSWQASPVKRIREKSTCPFCQAFGFRFPGLLHEWNLTENIGLDPMVIHAGSHQIVSWKCAKGHEWKTNVYRRSANKSNCPVCARGIAAIK